jgi:hypothetical protein
MRQRHNLGPPAALALALYTKARQSIVQDFTVIDRSYDHDSLDWMPGHIAMKKLAVTAFMLGILTVPAFAQGKDSEPLEIQDRDKKQQAEALDKQYKKMMDRNRKDGETQQRSDPWSNMRTPNEGKGK